ncbi:MAG: LD-carboxypeptidase [Rickettsiales bacterium]|nr:LD-carboxypeptidase [Pseudomonadota bacterium]MDA0965799.1 LD-carboxypeptidase [Pseudomonadota bacterium]MDG4543739.1 LD-carboxypeptidase [Rickettsiales bacterium]MDG4545886.1 LD-carboxypeptidase [Rickettsiales bacterium]MDG4548132.1 LD-carboxypeptidase [Rickettsiales bacterium]
MLKKGDIVDLIAPSSGFSEEIYNSCLKIIEDFGLKANTKPYLELIDGKNELTSNSVEYRFNHLVSALKNSESKAIWCIAGGYGSYQLLDKLGTIPAPVSKKAFIGFSDNTALMNFFVNKWNYPCIYAPPLKQIANGEVSQKALESLKKSLFEDKYDDIKLKPLNEKAKTQGQVAGKIIGGCLSLVQTTLGTQNSINTEGKIILLEDDKYETAGRIDRIFNHLGQAGFFKESVAIILGSFFEDEFEKKEKGFNEALESLKKYTGINTIPLFKADDIGHCKDMISVPFGTFVNIKTGENPVLKIGL